LALLQTSADALARSIVECGGFGQTFGVGVGVGARALQEFELPRVAGTQVTSE
jgi:hypothetical protein